MKIVDLVLRAAEMTSWPSSEKQTAWMPPSGSTGSVDVVGGSGRCGSCMSSCIELRSQMHTYGSVDCPAARFAVGACPVAQ